MKCHSSVIYCKATQKILAQTEELMKFVRRNVNVTKEPLSTWQRTKSTQTTLNKIIARHATWRMAEVWTWRMQKKINIMLRQKTTSMSRIDLTLWPSVCVYSQHSSGIISEIWGPGKSVHVEVVYVSLINHFRSKHRTYYFKFYPPPLLPHALSLSGSACLRRLPLPRPWHLICSFVHDLFAAFISHLQVHFTK